MNNLKIRYISFWSYIKFLIVSGACFGFGLGVICLILSIIFPDEVTGDIWYGKFSFTGLPAGLCTIVICPFIFAAMGALFGIIGYIPFKFLLKITKGLKLNIREEGGPK